MKEKKTPVHHTGPAVWDEPCAKGCGRVRMKYSDVCAECSTLPLYLKCDRQDIGKALVPPTYSIDFQSRDDRMNFIKAAEASVWQPVETLPREQEVEIWSKYAQHVGVARFGAMEKIPPSITHWRRHVRPAGVKGDTYVHIDLEASSSFGFKAHADACAKAAVGEVSCTCVLVGGICDTCTPYKPEGA